MQEKHPDILKSNTKEIALDEFLLQNKTKNMVLRKLLKAIQKEQVIALQNEKKK